MDKQGGRARRLQHARARQGDHHVHGGLMSDMHFSGMLINDIYDQGETQLGWSLGEFSEPGRESVISLAVQSTISAPSHFP